VRLVAAADKLHNIRSLLSAWRVQGDAVWQHFRGGREGTLWYYRAVLAALESGNSLLVAELARAVAELEALAVPR
jgi:hypothetical protein